MIFITTRKELMYILQYVTSNKKIYNKIGSLKDIDIKNDNVSISVHDKIFISINKNILIDFINGVTDDLTDPKMNAIKRSLRYNTVRCISKCNLYDLFYKFYMGSR